MQAIESTIKHIALRVPLYCPPERFQLTPFGNPIQLADVIEEVAGQSINIPDAFYARMYLPFTQFSRIRFGVVQQFSKLHPSTYGMQNYGTTSLY